MRMCGRFSLTRPIDAIRKLFGFSQIPNLPARYNIAPTQAVLAVRAPDPDKEAEVARQAFLARWGLVPSWAKDTSMASKMINARAETVAEKPAFRTAFRRSRCLIPADGFFEWKTENDVKQPYRIEMADDGLMAFAGLTERWRGPGGETIESCAIVTTEACAALTAVHHRMPVILDPDRFEAWLTGDPSTASKVMKPYTGPREFRVFAVSTRVNNVRNDDASILQPAEPDNTAAGDAKQKGKAGQLSLF